MKISGPFSICCFLVIVVAASQAMAQAMPDVEKESGSVSPDAEQAQRPRWHASVETTWLPGSRIDGNGGDLSMEEVRVGMRRRFGITPRLALTAVLRYSVLTIGAPESVRLPESLQAFSVSFGGEYRITDDLRLGLTVSPGLSSDFKAVGTEDVRVPVTLRASYRVSEKLTLMGGVRSITSRESLPEVVHTACMMPPWEQTP